MASGPSTGDILNREFQQLLKLGFRAVAVLLPLICLAEALSATDRVAWAIFTYDFSLALFFIGAALMIERRPPPPKWCHPVAFGSVVLLQVSILLTLHFERDLSATGNVGVVLIATGFFFLSTFWFAAYVVLALASWVLVTLATFGSEADILGTHSILAATVAGSVVHWTRVQTTLRLDRLNRREENHRLELAGALKSAESEIAERRRVEAELVTRVEMERLISRISSRFINLPAEELDAAIQDALTEIGTATGVDRTYVFQFSDDMKRFSCTHEWCASGIASHIDELQSLSVEVFPWIVQAHLEGQVVHIPRVADLPPEASAEREEFEREGIRTMLALTLGSSSTRLGFMGFDSVRSEKHWPEDMISLMSLVAEIILGALRRREAENALSASEERYRLLADNVEDVIWTMDTRFRPGYVTPSVERMLGYTPEEIYELEGARGTLDPEMLSQFGTPEEALNWIRRIGPGEMVELKFIHKDGHPVWTESTMKVLYDSQGNVAGLQGTTRDISARKRIEEEKAGLEDQLLQSQKMEAIGTLAGGIAHDFNNLLTGILGYSNMLKLETKPGTPIFEAADVIERAAERAAQLTRQLLGFARKGKFQNARIDVHATIQEVIMLLTRTISKNIEIESKLRAHNPYVSGDPTQIQQVILNIAVNARDAMPQGGRLSFETDDLEFDPEANPAPPELQNGRHFRLRIADTGPGIPESIRSRVFEPFFTTKDPGKGTGMGLATAYGIVKNHHGLLQLSREEGRGAVFEIVLPSLEAPSTEAVSVPAPEAGEPGAARVLLIDDEALICKIGSAMLRRLDYDVEAFSDPEDGLEAYRKNPDAFDVVILDVVMPRVDGMECMRVIRELNPEQRILLSSGFQQEGIVADALEDDGVGFIQKPYKLEALSRAVSSALNPRPA